MSTVKKESLDVHVTRTTYPGNSSCRGYAVGSPGHSTGGGSNGGGKSGR